MVTFLYNGRTYKAQDFQKKLKKLKITEADVKIIPNEHEIERERKIAALPNESWHNPNLYEFYNPKDKTTILSIYPTLEHLKEIVSINEYISIENLEGNRN